MKSSALRLLTVTVFSLVSSIALAVPTFNITDNGGNETGVEPTSGGANDEVTFDILVQKSPGGSGTAIIEMSGVAELGVDYTVQADPDVTINGDNLEVDISGGGFRQKVITLVPVFDNNTVGVEGSESVIITLLSDPDYNVGLFTGFETSIIDSETAAGIIVSNDAGGNTPVSQRTTSSDGGTDTFYVQLASAPGDDVDIPVTVGDNTEGNVSDSDESNEDSVTLTFTSGNWDTGQEVTITGEDSGAGSNQSYSISVGPATSADGVYNGLSGSSVPVINEYSNDPGTIQFTAAGTVNTAEGATVMLNVQRVGGSDGAVGVTYAIGDNETDGDDYTEQSSSPLAWSDGDSANKVIEIDIDDDDVNEGAETFTVTLSAPTGGAGLGSPTARDVSIAASDPTTYTITAPADVDEDSPAGDKTVEFTVTRTGGTPETSHDVLYNVVLDQATTGGVEDDGDNDYDGTSDPLSDTLTFGSGDTVMTFEININDDIAQEGNENFSAEISSVESAVSVSGPAVVTILASDAGTAGIINISPASQDLDEDAGTADFIVSRDGGSTGAASVDWSTIDGTAEDENGDDDYTSDGATLNWADGEDDDKPISVTINDDSNVESTEDFGVSISGATGADLGSALSLVNIIDNDNAGELGIDPGAYSGDEGDTVMVMVTRTGGSAGEVSVDYTTVDGTATDENTDGDYDSAAGTLTWPDGDTDPQAISVTLVDDGDNTEVAENFTVELSSFSGAAAGNDTGTVTINAAGFAPGQLSISPASYNVNENGGTVSVLVTRTGGSDGEVSIDWQTNDTGDATEDTDYVGASDTLVFADGDSATKQINITITDDADIEGDESFTVTLDDTSITGGATVSNDTGTVTILDDDDAEVGTVSVNGIVVSESNGTATLEISRQNGTDGDISATWSTMDGTAISGGDPLVGEDDYDANAGAFAWADGENDVKQVVITINEDDVEESSEDFTVEFEVTVGTDDPVNIPVTITIADNDGAGALVIGDLVVYEGSTEGGPAFLVVKRITNTVGPATVDYQSIDGSATAPDDYVAVAGSFSWADGEGCIMVANEEVCTNGERYIPIDVELDNVKETVEDFTVELLNESGPDGTPATIIVEKRVGTVQILDVVPVPTLSQFALALMALLLMGVGWSRMRAVKAAARS